MRKILPFLSITIGLMVDFLYNFILIFQPPLQKNKVEVIFKLESRLMTQIRNHTTHKRFTSNTRPMFPYKHSFQIRVHFFLKHTPYALSSVYILLPHT